MSYYRADNLAALVATADSTRAKYESFLFIQGAPLRHVSVDTICYSHLTRQRPSLHVAVTLRTSSRVVADVREVGFTAPAAADNLVADVRIPREDACSAPCLSVQASLLLLLYRAFRKQAAVAAERVQQSTATTPPRADSLRPARPAADGRKALLDLRALSIVKTTAARQ